MINILIADDNTNLISLIFKDIIRKNQDFRLTDYTCDGKNTLNSILQYHPDVIILDLHMPKLDGISIIKYLSSVKREYSPYIIVVSGIKEYINKIYNNKEVYAIIDKGVGFTRISNSLNMYLNEINKEITDKQIYEKVKNELKKFNINISTKGTTYLIDSILLSYNKEDLNLCNDIYPILSKKYHVKPMNIKWNLEKNIKSMKRYTSNEIINKYFHIDSRSNLTIKTVIKTITNNIR